MHRVGNVRKNVGKLQMVGWVKWHATAAATQPDSMRLWWIVMIPGDVGVGSTSDSTGDDLAVAVAVDPDFT